MDQFRKPEFVPEQTNFQKLLDTELKAAKAQDPDVSFEAVLAATAKKHPELYELHNRRIGGDSYAIIDTVENPYFKKVSDLLFNELKKVDRNAQYADAVAQCASFYPQLFESHLAEKIGVSLPQPKVQLSDRRKASATTGKGVSLDKFKFARRAFPQLVQEHLNEQKAEDKNARYEASLSEVSTRLPELYSDYVISLSA